jgi:soluble lytic murein transglycosylase-like protein
VRALSPRRQTAVCLAFVSGLALVAVTGLRQPAHPAPTRWIEDQALPQFPVEVVARRERSPLADKVAATALRYDLDPDLVLALIQVESDDNPDAVSDKGALGLMQVMPETAAWVGVPHAADPATNLEAGCRYLATLIDDFGGDVELALAAYNAGPGAVQRWGTVPPYRETRDFVARVSAAYRRTTGMDVRTATRLVADPSTLF